MTESVTETQNSDFESIFHPSKASITSKFPSQLELFQKDEVDLTQTPMPTPAQPKNSASTFVFDEQINFQTGLPTPNAYGFIGTSQNGSNLPYSRQNSYKGDQQRNSYKNKNAGYKMNDFSGYNPSTTALPNSIQNTPVSNRSFQFPESNYGYSDQNFGFENTFNSPIHSPNNNGGGFQHHMTFDFYNSQPYKAIRKFCNEIFIGNLPKNLTRDEIYKQLRNYDLGDGLHLYIKQFKQPRCTARRDSKGCLVLNVGYAFIVTKTQEMAEKLISLKYIKLKQLDGTMVKAEISPIDSYKRDKGHKDWEKSQNLVESGSGDDVAGVDSGMGGTEELRSNFELCSINEKRDSSSDGAPIQSVFDSIPRL